MSYRCVVSVVVALALFLLFFQPFLPYSQRSQFSLHWWPFPVAALLCGFLLSFRLPHRRFWIPTSFLLTLFAANTVLIAADEITGTVDHNLAPIEFLFIALLASPVYLGALISFALDRLRTA